MNKALLDTMVGQVIRVDRGGPNAAVGKLLKAGNDYFVLLTKKDGVILYTTHHVKSITLDSKDQGASSVTVPEGLEGLFDEDNLKGVLCKIGRRWVKINPEKLEGVLNEVCDDYLTIIYKEEIIYVSMFHLRNIIISGTSSSGEENNEESDNNESENSSGGRRRRRR